MYPWGDAKVTGQRANFCDKNCVEALTTENKKTYAEKNLIVYSEDDGYSSTSPVGVYPNGATKWGLQDMAGNAYQWTGSDYDAENKELRGGSWSKLPRNIRASMRDYFKPDSWNAGMSVRCAL